MRVYHNRDDCPSARKIPYTDRVAGALDYRLCAACRRLGRATRK
jgi:hypothetical protein